MKIPGMPSKGSLRLSFLCLFFALGSFEWGYNVGVLSSILVHPGFKSMLGWLSKPNPTEKGLITAMYYLGTLISYFFISQPLSDRLGRRYACLSAVVISGVGIALQASARGDNGRGLAMLLVGRCVTGMGSAVMSTTVPMYQSEVSPTKHRGRYVVMNHVGFIVGLSTGFWVGYAMTFWSSESGLANGWRLSLSIQYIPSLIFALYLPFVPETPRWLLSHSATSPANIARARKSLIYLREGISSPSEIEAEIREIEQSVFPSSGAEQDGLLDSLIGKTKTLFTEEALWARLWRATLLHFMGTMCGATAMKYYLPTLFRRLGFGTRVALIAGGIESLMKIPMNLVDAALIDRLGRRWTLTVGCGLMALGMMVNGLMPSVTQGGDKGTGDRTDGGGGGNRAADWTAVVFIFVYAMGYSVGFGPATWVYSSEIFPTYMRARGLNLAASGGSIGSLITAQIWPIGVHAFGAKIYYYFMTINLLCIPILWLFYPETARVTLEDMDLLFGSSLSSSNPHHRRPKQRDPLAHHMDAEGRLIGDDDGDDYDSSEDEGGNGNMGGYQGESDEEADYGWPAYRDEDDAAPQPLRYVMPSPILHEGGRKQGGGEEYRGASGDGGKGV